MSSLGFQPTGSGSDLRGFVEACAAPTALVDAAGCLLATNAAFDRQFTPQADSTLGLLLGSEANCAELAEQAPLAVTSRPDGRLHLQAVGDSRLWLAQWQLECVDRGEEQRQLQMFADTVAHDLRAPLRSIDSFAKLLEDSAAPKLDAAERMHLSRIRTAATRMGALLTALGELSRAASAQLQPQDVDMSLLAEWVGAELQDADAARDVSLIVQPGLRAWGDERLLKQLLRALVENAWTFTRGCDVARIEIAGERIGGRLRMQVRDTGCGFDMHYAHKLFEPFQRLHGVEQGAGHGLGLAIAQRIARRHGGFVSADSRVDEGSTFTVDLPAVAGEGDNRDA